MTSSSSSSWPWMKGVDIAIADPIDPVCPEDDRPAVKDLIKEHGDKIAKIREALIEDPLFDENKHDDLWILRFWMSHKKSKDAIKAAKHTLAFRAEHKLDETDIRDTPPHKVKDGKVAKYLSYWEDDAIIMTHPDDKRGVICFLKLTSMHQHAVVDNLTEEYWVPIFMYCSEWTHQWIDYVTRTTGRLTRSVRFVDAEGVTLGLFNRECARRDGNAMGLMEDCYPQLLETLFMCHPPAVIKVIWKVVRVILPKRVLNKFDMINPRDKENERKRAYRHISEKDLPIQFGGKNAVPVVDW